MVTYRLHPIEPSSLTAWKTATLWPDVLPERNKVLLNKKSTIHSDRSSTHLHQPREMFPNVVVRRYVIFRPFWNREMWDWRRNTLRERNKYHVLVLCKCVVILTAIFSSFDSHSEGRMPDGRFDCYPPRRWEDESHGFVWSGPGTIAREYRDGALFHGRLPI